MTDVTLKLSDDNTIFLPFSNNNIKNISLLSVFNNHHDFFDVNFSTTYSIDHNIVLECNGSNIFNDKLYFPIFLTYHKRIYHINIDVNVLNKLSTVGDNSITLKIQGNNYFYKFNNFIIIQYEDYPLFVDR